jgi:hypothetical protein
LIDSPWCFPSITAEMQEGRFRNNRSRSKVFQPPMIRHKGQCSRVSRHQFFRRYDGQVQTGMAVDRIP